MSTIRPRVSDKLLQFRATVDNIPAFIAIHNESGELELENRTAREYHGLSVAETKQWQTSDVVHPDDLPALIAAHQRALTTGQPLELEVRLRRADSVYRWFQLRSVRSSDDYDGASRWYTVGTDINDRKTAEEALQRSEASLRENERHSRLIVDNIPGLFGLLTAEGRLQFLNRQILDYTGMTLEELKERGTIATIHPEDRPHVMQVYAQSIAAGTPYEMVWRFRRSDGVYRWFQNNGFPVRDASGHIVGWCVLMTDIDDRKRAEDALHGMQTRLSHATQIAAVGEMTGSIAHEVNQPLAAVVANGHACLRWLSASPPNVAKAIEAAERIVKDGKDAGEVVRRVRALFRRTVLEKVPLDLREVIAEVVRLLDSYPARKHVSLDVVLDSDLPPVVADRVQVQQLVLNLMLNALEALEPVSGRVKQRGPPCIVSSYARTSRAGSHRRYFAGNQLGARRLGRSRSEAGPIQDDVDLKNATPWYRGSERLREPTCSGPWRWKVACETAAGKHRSCTEARTRERVVMSPRELRRGQALCAPAASHCGDGRDVGAGAQRQNRRRDIDAAFTI